MYVDYVTKRRPASPSPNNRTAERPRRVSAAVRRARLSDAIVSQWLLEQVPSEHRHALRGVNGRA